MGENTGITTCVWPTKLLTLGNQRTLEHRAAAERMRVFYPCLIRVVRGINMSSVKPNKNPAPRCASPRAHVHVVGMLRFMSLTQAAELAHSCLLCSCVCFCLYGPFNCISFHKFSRHHSAFSVCSSGCYFCLLVLLTIISLLEGLPQPWYNHLWLTGLKAPTDFQTV